MIQILSKEMNIRIRRLKSCIVLQDLIRFNDINKTSKFFHLNKGVLQSIQTTCKVFFYMNLKILKALHYDFLYEVIKSFESDIAADVTAEVLDLIQYGVVVFKIVLSQIELKEAIIDSERYYDGLIFVDLDFSNKTNKEIQNKELFIKEFARKMNCESRIVLLNSLENSKYRLEEKLYKELSNEIGVKINSLNLNMSLKEKNIMIDKIQIAEDTVELLTKFKNTTGNFISTDAGALKFDEFGRTEKFEIGPFYKVITQYFKSLKKDSVMWCASTMMEDEWTEEPAEMHFRVTNLDAANKGANLERIFIFSKSKIKEFKDNKTLKIYMQSNIHAMFVDYDEILEKEPELLEIVGDGWDGIDKDTLIVDLPSGQKTRGYVSINKYEVLKAYECFQKLKTYAKDLKEILK